MKYYNNFNELMTASIAENGFSVWLDHVIALARPGPQ